MASSTGRKGRLLTALIHEFQPRHILEVGTAYGVSAAFMLEANAETHVVTVETFSPMKELSARRLQSRYPGRVTIVHQPIDEWLQGRDPVFDAVFHDGHHDGPGYVRDFQAIVPRLTSGAVFVFDDIRYGDPAVYRGWQQVVRDERVEAAYEVDNDLGVLILH